jgi:CheY-like chemotaxis protein
MNKFLFSFFRSSKSSYKLLKKWLGRSTYKQIKRNSDNIFYLFENAAARFNVSIDILLFEVAKALNLKFVDGIEDLKPFSLLSEKEVKAMYNLSSKEFVSLGGVLLRHPDRTALYCLEPENFKIHVKKYPQLELAITTPSIIKSFVNQNSSPVNNKTKIALESIVKQFFSYNAEAIFLHLTEPDFFYEIALSCGKTARGNINESLRDEFNAFFSVPINKLILAGKNFDVSIRENLSYKFTLNNSSPATLTHSFKPLIALLDDDKSFLSILEIFLQKEDFSTVSFSSPSALESYFKSADRVEPALVLCDYHINHLESEDPILGSEVLKRLKQQQLVGHIPFIFLTSDESLSSELDILNSGGCLHFSKSRDPNLLMAYLKRFMEMGGRGH